MSFTSLTGRTMIDLGASLLEPLACGCPVSRTGMTGFLSILWLFDHVRIASRGTQTSVTKLVLRIVSTSWLLRDLTAAGLPGYQPKIFRLSSLEMIVGEGGVEHQVLAGLILLLLRVIWGLIKERIFGGFLFNPYATDRSDAAAHPTPQSSLVSWHPSILAYFPASVSITTIPGPPFPAYCIIISPSFRDCSAFGKS